MAQSSDSNMDHQKYGYEDFTNESTTDFTFNMPNFTQGYGPMAGIPMPSQQPVQPCFGCAVKSQNPAAHAGITPSPLLSFPCGHSQCRSCLTETHFSKGPAWFRSTIYCPNCGFPAGFAPYQHVPLTEKYVLETASIDLLDVNSPNYAAGNRFIFEGQEARAIFIAVSRLHGEAKSGDPPNVLDITNQQVFNTLDAHIVSNGPYRLLTPILLATELQDVVLGDLVYKSLVSRPGAPHRALAPYLNTGHNEDDWRRQTLLVKVLREKHQHLEVLMVRWESVVVRWVTILARQWWARFDSGFAISRSSQYSI